MRKFKLINAEGQEFDLMRKDAFFFSPSGLGYEMQFDTTPAGYDFIELDSEMLQKTVSGSVVFAGYEQYEEFALFVSKEPLQLAYQPLEEWRYINCKIARLTKGEKESGSHRLISDVDFLCLSTWYESLKVVNTEVDPGDREDIQLSLSIQLYRSGREKYPGGYNREYTVLLPAEYHRAVFESFLGSDPGQGGPDPWKSVCGNYRRPQAGGGQLPGTA